VLARLGWKPESDSERAAYLIATRQWDKVLTCGDAAVPLLEERARDADPEVREEARWLLDEMRSARELEELLRGLKEE